MKNQLEMIRPTSKLLGHEWAHMRSRLDHITKPEWPVLPPAASQLMGIPTQLTCTSPIRLWANPVAAPTCFLELLLESLKGAKVPVNGCQQLALGLACGGGGGGSSSIRGDKQS
jgi:hypothetical protein